MAGEFRLDIRKKFFTKELVDIGMGCQEMVESPPWSVQGKVLCAMV